MKQKVLNVFKVVLFLVIGIWLFLGIQDLFTVKSYPGTMAEETFSAFYGLKKNSVDVLMFGNSHIYCGIYPMKLYENTGIVSYSLATGSQPIALSYYLLKEALKTQTPKIVIVDPSNLFTDEIDSAWRVGMDNMPLNDVKIELAYDYGRRQFGGGYWSVIFPIIKYHSRWNELTGNDYISNWYMAGEVLNSRIVSNGITMTDIDTVVNAIRERNPAFLNEFNGNATSNKSFQNNLFEPLIYENKREYLLKIKQLCDDYGAELILTTIPTLQYPWIKSSWNREKSTIIKQFATEEGIIYLDLIYDYDLKIDNKTDFFDDGFHLNCNGAQKVTNFLGDYLLTKIQPTGNNELYDEMLVKFNKAYDVAMLESETDFYSYIENLSQRLDKSTIFICADNEYTVGMTSEDYSFLSDKLGVQMVQTGTYTDSYIAVLDKGQLLYEAVSNREIDHDIQIGGMKVNLVSSGWLAKPNSSVKINGKEYAQGGRGLNIVVYDNESGLVVDSVAFDTYQATKPSSRTSVDTLLRAYEKKMCL